ncbi:Nn.00g014240.m01.CDS01 [Neocucurbitaria sp. VM-36]
MAALLQRLTAPPSQTLRTLQPTPSTVQYTVSTRPIPTTIPAILGFCSKILIRVLVGLATALLLWTKWRITFEQSTATLQNVLGTAREAWLLKLAGSCQWRFLAPSALVILFLVFRRSYTEESIILLRGLGIQTSTSSSTYLLTPTTRFIPTTSIQDIFIHEAFKGFEVRFYLAIVVEGEKDVVVVFPGLLPRREILEVVWRGARSCLWESGAKGMEKGQHKGKGKERAKIDNDGQ